MGRKVSNCPPPGVRPLAGLFLILLNHAKIGFPTCIEERWSYFLTGERAESTPGLGPNPEQRCSADGNPHCARSSFPPSSLPLH